MAGPLQMYLYIHEAILREVADFEAQSRELNRDSADDIAALDGRLSWFHKMVKAHERAEEEVLFPAMNDRYRFVAETYQFDHDDFEVHVFGRLSVAIAGLENTTSNEERRDHGRHVYRQCVALHEHMRLHISKENELLLPKLEEEFDVSEQAEIAGAMAGVFDPKLMAETVGWMYQGQTASDREGMVRFLMGILPDEAFDGITHMLAGMGAAEWAEVQRRVPDLGGNGA